jgi:hypothetical protein
LVDEDDDGRLEAAVQHLQQLLPARHTNNNGGDSVSQSPTRYTESRCPHENNRGEVHEGLGVRAV